MPPLIHTSKIIAIDEGSPIKKHGGFPAPKLALPISKVTVTLIAQEVIKVTIRAPIKDKGNGVTFSMIIPMKLSKKSKGWSQDQINEALESLQIQHLKDSPNPLYGISPYYDEGRLYEHHKVPFVSHAPHTSHSEQLNHPISLHDRFYVKFTTLHLSDEQEILLRTERERLSTFYSINALSKERSMVKTKNYKINVCVMKLFINFG